MTLSEKVAYLKGLAEGMKVDGKSDEGRLLTEIIGVLEDVADSVTALEDECDRLNDYVEEIDEDLGDAEEYLYGDDEDDEYEDDDDYDEDDDFDLDDEDEDYDDDVIEVECPPDSRRGRFFHIFTETALILPKTYCIIIR